MRALLPNYRLAPSTRFRQASTIAWRFTVQLLAAGMTPGQVAIAGDSAGGGMAMAVLLSLRDAGDPLPRAACLLSPWLDLAGR